MCGRGDIDYSAQKIREAFADLGELDVHMDLTAARHNVSPTDPVPVVHIADERLQLDGMRWGSKPGSSGASSGASSRARGRPIILVRSESVARGSLASRTRGLVVFSKFYEWQGAKGTKRKPYAIQLPGGRLAALAALCGREISSDGEVTETCTILTQPALGTMTGIHDRMPIVVTPGHFGAWLETKASTPDALAVVREDQIAVADSLAAFPEDPYELAHGPRPAKRARTEPRVR